MPFDESRARDAIGFIEYLPQSKGKWAGQKLDLMPWQRAVTREVFGRVDEDGNRIINTVFVFVPRKNGKSTWAAAIANYLLFGDGEPGAEVYGAAWDRDQASIVFNQALQMIQGLEGGGDPDSGAVGEKAWRRYKQKKRIEVPETNSFYEAIPAVAAGSHGYNAHGVIFDEFHTQKDRELWDVLTTSMDTREQPLTFVITTAGVHGESPCKDEYEYAKKVDEGVIDDPSYLPVIYEADSEEDWDDPEQWEQANPALGYTFDKKALSRDYRKAKHQPEKESAFKRLRLNLWVSSESKVISPDQWRRCVTDIDEAELYGHECYGGLDLASKVDVAACVWAFPSDEGVKLLPRFWIPEETVAERTRKDGVPYDKWAREGYLTTTPGSRIDYAFIREQVTEDADQFDVREMAYDPWNAGQLTQELTQRGMEMVEVRQGYKSMSEPTKQMLGMIRSEELQPDDNPAFAWMADNLVVTEDPAGNIKPAKNKSEEKIDGVVAAINALDRVLRHDDSTSKYESEEMLVLG